MPQIARVIEANKSEFTQMIVHAIIDSSSKNLVHKTISFFFY